VGELDGVEDGLFFYFFGSRFDHYDRVGGGNDHQAEQAFAHLFIGGVDDELPVKQADADCPDWAVKGNVAEGQRGRCAVDGKDVRVVFGVGGEDERNDLGFTAESFGEQRTDGAIDLAAGEGFAVTHAAFALDEAAGDAATGVSVFAVVDGEREEGDANAGFGVGAGRG